MADPTRVFKKEEEDLEQLLSRIAYEFNFDLEETKRQAQEKLERERKLYWKIMNNGASSEVSVQEIQKTLQTLESKDRIQKEVYFRDTKISLLKEVVSKILSFDEDDIPF
jgi:lipopolysaccharide biosynthesis glycosyltransferase